MHNSLVLSGPCRIIIEQQCCDTRALRKGASLLSATEFTIWGDRTCWKLQGFEFFACIDESNETWWIGFVGIARVCCWSPPRIFRFRVTLSLSLSLIYLLHFKTYMTSCLAYVICQVFWPIESNCGREGSTRRCNSNNWGNHSSWFVGKLSNISP